MAISMSSSKKRLSVGFDGLQQSIPVVLNNDSAELASRRQSIALKRRLDHSSSVARIPHDASDSIRILSEDELKSQILLCCKLHSDNKINADSAWQFTIIDTLKQFVKKNHPDTLKLAGSSLEVANKVYGLKVDSLYTDGLKLAGNLNRNYENEDENSDGNNENNTSGSNEDNSKKKRCSRRKQLMSKDKKNIIKSEPMFFIGQLSKLDSAEFSNRIRPELGLMANLATNTVVMDAVGFRFILGTKEPAWKFSKSIERFNETIKILVEEKCLKDIFLSAPLKDFDLNEKENIANSTILKDLVLDSNGVPVPELDSSVHDVFSEIANDEYLEENACPLNQKGHLENIVNFSQEVSALTFVGSSSGEPLTHIGYIWAGPSHWKLKHIKRKKAVYTGTDERDQNLTKKKSKKDLVQPLDFTSAPLTHDFTTEKVKSRQPQNFYLNPQKITLPLFTLPVIKILENQNSMMIKPSVKVVPKIRGQLSDVNYNGPEYNYDNPNDSNYCLEAIPNDVEENNFNNNMECDNVPELEDNLVEAPETVHLSFVPYATKAKKIDMRKLKENEWKLLTSKDEPLCFSELYKQLLEKTPKQKRKELSCSIAFVTLLHLCNEQNLHLKQQNHKDFYICSKQN